MSSMIPNVQVPEGSIGHWVVERFCVSEQDAKFENMRAMFSSSARPIRPGIYTRLTRGGRVVMSDTPVEKGDHLSAVYNARGHCLVNGLGLGMVANAMLLKPEVTKVTAVEIAPHVIELVAPHYKALYGDRFETVCASAFDYRPPRGERYGAVWHDIWDNLCSDNIEQMTTLKRRYGRRADWQGCWGEDECRRYARHNR